MTPAQSRGSVIPLPAWVAAAVCLFLIPVLINVTTRKHSVEARVMMPAIVGLAVCGNILAIGYVYGDARRRGMRYVMWTLLATFLFWGVGIVVYFILREPLVGFCSRCGKHASQGFAYCPHCGAGLQPACPACHRTVEGPWSHCAWCGTQLVARPVVPTGMPPGGQPG